MAILRIMEIPVFPLISEHEDHIFKNVFENLGEIVKYKMFYFFPFNHLRVLHDIFFPTDNKYTTEKFFLF